MAQRNRRLCARNNDQEHHTYFNQGNKKKTARLTRRQANQVQGQRVMIAQIVPDWVSQVFVVLASLVDVAIDFLSDFDLFVVGFVCFFVA
jgi:hypothetical protein